MVQHRGQPRSCECCCPPAVGCVLAADDFERPDGPVGPAWIIDPIVLGFPNTPEPRIEDKELLFDEGPDAGFSSWLRWCRNFPEDSHSGSIAVDVIGGVGDSAGLWIGGIGGRYVLLWTVAEDHVLLESHGNVTGVGQIRAFQLPGGPGIRQRLRMCWDGTQTVLELYDDEGQLIFRDRIAAVAVPEGGLQHGVVAFDFDEPYYYEPGYYYYEPHKLRFDNYLAEQLPEPYYYDGGYYYYYYDDCAACEPFVKPALCLVVDDPDECGVDPLLRDLDDSGGGAGSDPCRIPAERTWREWGTDFNTDSLPWFWYLQIGQEEDGTWIANGRGIGGGVTGHWKAELDLGGNPTPQNLMDALLGATLVFTNECLGLGMLPCQQTVTLTVVEGSCYYYYYGGDDPVCCEGSDRPENLTATVIKNGEPYGEIALYFDDFSLPGNFTYTDNPVDGSTFFDAYILCIQELGQLAPVFGIESEGLSIELGVISCDPFHFAGSTSLGGNVWEVEITP